MNAQGRPRGAAAERMLQVAAARIEVEGMSVGLDQVRMEQVIEEAGCSRATAYRRWPSREAFAADVLVEVVRRTSLLPETEQEVAQLVKLVAASRDRLGSETGRRDLVVEALRVSVDFDVRRLVGSTRWRTFLSLSATHQSLAEGSLRESVGDALRLTEATHVARRAAIYANLAFLIGYRPTLLGTYETLASASGAMMTGVVVRATVDPGWLDRREVASLYGASESAPWSEPERHLVGVLLAHLEPDPQIEWGPGEVRDRFATFQAQAAAMYDTTTKARSAPGPG